MLLKRERKTDTSDTSFSLTIEMKNCTYNGKKHTSYIGSCGSQVLVDVYWSDRLRF